MDIPIFYFNSVLPYLFTIFFVIGSACFLMPTFLLLVMAVIRFSPPNTNFSPPNGGALINASGVTNGWSAPSWGADAVTRRADGVFHPPTSASPMTTSAVDLPLGSSVDSLRQLGGQSGAVLKHQLDIIDAQIRRNNKTPSDVYPSNRITVRCGKCGLRIGAGEGYQHYNIGTRKTFCITCHQSMGLPLRDEHLVNSEHSAKMGDDEV